MLVCGFFQPLQQLPAPILRYPLSYISFHTFAFTGFMRNEFEGTDGWLCPELPGLSVDNSNCTLNGADVLSYYDILSVNKWICLLILICNVVFYRTLCWATLKIKEKWAQG